MIMFYDKDLYYLLYSCTNSIFGGDMVLEIWVEMLLTNQIAGFLNQIDLQNKVIKKPEFLHVDTNSWKLNAD